MLGKLLGNNEPTKRKAREVLACPKCRAPMGSVALPEIGARTSKLVNATLSTMIDSDVDVNALSLTGITTSFLDVLCLSCSAGAGV